MARNSQIFWFVRPASTIARLLPFLLFALVHLGCPPAQASKGGLNLGIEPHESQRLFDAAVQQWDTVFDAREMRSTLEALAKGEHPTKKVRKKLKTVRRRGGRLRASFQLFGEQHRKPKSFNAYIVAAGKLNDALGSKKKKGKVASLAAKTLKLMELDRIQAEVDAFVPSSAESFKGYLFTSMLFAQKVGSKKKLEAPVYHQLRKEMTNLLALFDTVPPPGATKRLYDRLQALRIEMGDVHDDLVAKKTKAAKSYTTKKVKLASKTRKKLRNVIQSLRLSKPVGRTTHYKRWRDTVKPGRGRSKAAPKRLR